MSGTFEDMIYAPKELSVALADGLAAAGHEVIMATAPDVSTKARVVAGDQRFIDCIGPIKHPAPDDAKARHEHFLIKRDYEVDLLTRAYEVARKERVDIIHAYAVTMTHYFQQWSDRPVVYTLHDPLPGEGTLGYRVFEKFADHNYVAISNSQRQSALPLHFVATVYHGLDVSRYPYQGTPGDYVLFMGRLVPEKGLHSAIAAAIAAGVKLEIGTDFKGHERDPYFISQIQPHISNPLIAEPGLVGPEEKMTLYSKAKALLFPIEWEEPFGLVMIEAMACGTPVVAYGRGSVPEVVRDGVTGFIVDPGGEPNVTNSSPLSNLMVKTRGVEGLGEAIRRVGEIDRAACRRHVEERFTIETMVRSYECVYEHVTKS